MSADAALRPALARPGARAAVYALDAAVFVFVVYGAVRAHLQARDGVLAPAQALLVVVPAAACFVALALLVPRLLGGPPRPRAVAAELLAVLAFCFVPGWASDLTPRKGETYLWVAQEWTKIPENHALLLVLFPGLGAAIALVFAGIAALAANGRLGRWRATAPIALAALVFALMLTMEAGFYRGIVYFIVYVLPWLIAAAGFAVARPRLATRAAAFGCATTLLLVPYVGLLPLGRARFDQRPGVTRIYPPPGATPAIPLAFLRDFALDAARGEIYSSFGPTSGMLKLTLATGALETIPTDAGLVRDFWTEDGLDYLYALDWVQGDLLEVGKQPFAVRARYDLFAPQRVVPMSFLVGRDRIELVYTELPGLVELERPAPSPADALAPPDAEPPPPWDPPPQGMHPARFTDRSLAFRDLGVTRFRSGAWYSAGAVDDGFVVVEVGAIDAAKRYRLLRVDLASYSITASADLPHGGLALLRVPEHRAIVAAGFFTDRFFEYDEQTLALRRTFRGPRNCRELRYDARRDTLVAAAFLPGELWVLPWATPEQPLVRDRVGNKAMSLALDAARDVLYLGSREGVFSVDLATYLGPAPHPATPAPLVPSRPDTGGDGPRPYDEPVAAHPTTR